MDSESVAVAGGTCSPVVMLLEPAAPPSTEISTYLREIVEDSCAFTAEMKSKDKMREDAGHDYQVDFTTARRC